MAGKLLFPAFPQSRALLWVLGGISAAVVITGLVTGDTTTLTVGAVGAAGCLIAFPLSRLLLGAREDEDGS